MSNPVHWADFFQSLFGVNSADWFKTLKAWTALFTAEGRANSELCSAVVSVSRRNPLPKFPMDYLEALREELKRQDDSLRDNQEARRIASTGKPMLCHTCRDSGWVSVPHPQCVQGHEWKPRNTVAVTCHCGLGHHINQRWANRQENPRQVLSFLEYERQNPFWEAQLDLQKKEREAELAAYRQQHGEPKWAKLAVKIVEDYRERGDVKSPIPAGDSDL